MTTQRWPTAWLMTDERLGEQLDLALVSAAAAGAGILVRHHASSTFERRNIALRVKALGVPLGISRDVSLARELDAVLVHNPKEDAGMLPFSLSVHNEEEALAAGASSPALVFVSPIYPTRSHPGAAALGEVQALKLAKLSGCSAIALGGMDVAKGAKLMARGFAGWAGIDCWLRT